MGQFAIFLSLLLLSFISMPFAADASVPTRFRPPPDACSRCQRVLDGKKKVVNERLLQVREMLDEACFNMDTKVVDICDRQAKRSTQALVREGGCWAKS